MIKTVTAFEKRLSDALFLNARKFGVLQCAPSHPARMVRMNGLIGCAAPAAFADLVPVDSEPPIEPGLLARSVPLSLVMQAERVVRGRS